MNHNKYPIHKTDSDLDVTEFSDTPILVLVHIQDLRFQH